MQLQHEHHDLVVSTSHAHLAHDACLEVLMVHGISAKVERFAGRMIGLKGAQHGRLVMTAPAIAIVSSHKSRHAHRQKEIQKL